MPSILSEILGQLRAIWSRLDAGQRLTIGAVLTVAAVGLGAIVWYAQQPDWVVISSRPETFSQAAEALESAGIKTKQDGLKVMVSRQDYDRGLRALDSAGLRADSTSTKSVLDTLTSSAETNRARLWAARVNAIEAKIAKSRAISFVQITAAQPTRREFSGERDTNGATVMIRLARGADFNNAARFAGSAAASGLQLPLEKVVVYDTEGDRVYTFKSQAGGASGDGSEFLRLQMMWENTLATKAREVLYKVFQEDFEVTLTLALKPTVTQSKSINPPESGLQPNVTESTSKEDQSGPNNGSGSPGGAPATGQGGSSGVASSTTDKTEKKITDVSLYGVKSVAQLAPFIERISVAVVANSESEVVKNMKGELKAVEDLVKSAVGFDKARGDEITAKSLPFAPLPPPVEAPSPDMMALAEKFGPPVGQVLAVLLVILFLRSTMKRAQGKRPPPEPERSVIDENTEALEPSEVARRMRREIERAIHEDPKAISRMLDNWLTEQKA
ncbi:MAG: hypothetical protein KDC87_11625 [Planctomycetes bacterium]|nr:hypothetical protein [Planctomycetota bacterium]MCB9872236.1 hypothetical protein [Planctomycetota bacterium]MCB9888056.1 hypothetical protein [Planctomycetota bacterium]